MNQTREKLIFLLQKAHAGERAAALAYGGHWRILKDADERAAVKQIEADEWRHRREIADFLFKLDAQPRKIREFVFYSIGSFISLSCFLTGRFVSTYFAGILEKGNVNEYGEAFRLAKKLRLDFAEEFLAMEATEAEHEQILQQMIAKNRLLPFFRYFFGWGASKNVADGKIEYKSSYVDSNEKKRGAK